MNSAKLNDWLQVIGIFALVASLIFVGLQMKQTHAIALSEIYQGRAVAAREANVANASNPYFLSGTAKIYAGKPEDLTAQEAIALQYEFESQVITADNYYQQYVWGYLEAAYWNRTVAELTCYFEKPFFRQAIIGSEFRSEFQQIIDDMMTDAIENPSDCWEFDFDYPIEN